MLIVGVGVAIVAVNWFVSALAAAHPNLAVPLTLTWLSVLSLLIVPWLLIGLLRTAETDREKTGYNTRLYATQALLLVCLIATANHVIVSLQLLVAQQTELADTRTNSTDTYTLTQHNATLHITGLLDFGITQEVETLLNRSNAVRRVTLDSEGGQLYEGRGLARLIETNHLDTCVVNRCNSACIIAFLAGSKRSIGTNGTMGFHQYRFDENRQRQNIGLFDISAEEEKDRDIYRARGVDEQFIKRVFDTPASGLWTPTLNELTEAGVVNADLCGTG